MMYFQPKKISSYKSNNYAWNKINLSRSNGLTSIQIKIKPETLKLIKISILKK
jgi:hypothetical protein